MKFKKELEWFIIHNQFEKYPKEEIFTTWEDWNSMKGVHNYDFAVNEGFGYNYIDASQRQINSANKNCEKFCNDCKYKPNKIWNTTTEGYVGSRYKEPTNTEMVEEIKERLTELMAVEKELHKQKSNECYFLEDDSNHYIKDEVKWYDKLGEEADDLKEWMDENLFDYYYENWMDYIRNTDEYKEGIKEFTNKDGEISEEGYEWEECFTYNFNTQYYIVDDIISAIEDILKTVLNEVETEHSSVELELDEFVEKLLDENKTI